MELLTYFARSFLILFLFLGIYQLLLRNDAHFKAIRFFLLFGLITAMCLPMVELKYTIWLEQVEHNELFVQVDAEDAAPIVTDTNKTDQINWYAAGMYFYLFVTGIFIIRITWMLIKMLLLVRSSRRLIYKGVTVCIHPKVEMPFVFGYWMFIQHARYLNAQHAEIINHERVHLLQQHWIDVLLSELFIVFQWFNPFAWHYARLIKQNLEFLADRGVLQSGHKYENYIQTIICETMGAEVSVLANHFRFSQNKRRLKMMKNDKKSKWRLLKLLLVLPLVGSLLWAFSKPVYEYRSNSESINDKTVQDEKEKFVVKGTVYFEEEKSIKNEESGLFELHSVGRPIPGTSIVLKGKTIGTVADMDGHFRLELTKEDIIVFSFVGFETQEIIPKEGENLNVVLKKTAYQLDPSAYRKKYKGKITPPPPGKKKKEKEIAPPPPPPPPAHKDGEPVFYVVEDMPNYKGGMDSYFALLYTYIEFEKRKETLSGKVNVQFKVKTDGGVSDVQALERLDEREAKVAVSIVSKMKNWTPGKQRGKKVSTTMIVPVEFD
jgi:hypothetical protein